MLRADIHTQTNLQTVFLMPDPSVNKTVTNLSKPTSTDSGNTVATTRQADLLHWLEGLANTHELQLDTLEPASGDASFRRYFRVSTRNNGTLIIMDAPPPHENCHPFMHVTGLLADTGVRVPRIHAHDLANGFMLLDDLGKFTYYQVLQTNPDDAALQSIYRDALAALVKMQQAATDGLPVYTADKLREELSVFPEWYVGQLLKTTLTPAEQSMLSNLFQLLVDDAIAQPQVLVHRDYHSPNLMLTEPAKNPGVIDYQDALKGPIAYDIASLVTDARTTWEEPQQLDWAIRYWEMARAARLPVPDDFAVFHQQYEWISLQRNLRILGVFARLSLRDQKHHYLEHIPRVLGYVRQVAFRYQPLRPLIRLLNRLDELTAPPGEGA